jgi:hypothetical protein
MKEFTREQQELICDYFRGPGYPQPFGENVVTQLLSSMIASGKYEMEEYPRLAEAAIQLTKILALRFDEEAGCFESKPDPKSEGDIQSSEDFPIPF